MSDNNDKYDEYEAQERYDRQAQARYELQAQEQYERQAQERYERLAAERVASDMLICYTCGWEGGGGYADWLFSDGVANGRQPHCPQCGDSLD